jgi:hypothetical protein
VPAEGGQAAILVDSAEFLKNRKCFVHSRDFWWVNGTTQELLGRGLSEATSRRQFEVADLDVLVLPR